jgi:hypothetical protein
MFFFMIQDAYLLFGKKYQAEYRLFALADFLRKQ